jgi:hypothetical protein
MAGIHYDLIRKDGRTVGLLLSDIEFRVPIYGHDVQIDVPAQACRLTEVGTLHVFAGVHWDFGSGPAVDTPAVVKASLAHDCLCWMTDTGRLPWECRAIADKVYRELLQQYGCPWFRRWYQWAGVRAYSKTVAYWNRTK